MKNIHLIPTDKPSRLGYLTKKGKEVFNDLRLFEKSMPNILDSENQNIYITSDEEIKEGDWMIRGNEQPTLVTPNFFWDFGVRYYKIILTTDQDLIADGVQAIDDTFLEWFVQNPSCESVVVNFNYKKFRWSELNKSQCYKIIIPQEEPKQDKWDTLNKELDDALKEEFGSKEPKQETLEEIEKNIDREEWINFFKNNSKEEILEYLINYKFPL
jgi:hypothetical protein